MPCSTRSYEDDLDDGLSDSDLILAGDVHTSSNLTNVQYSDDTVDDNDLLAAEACFGRGTWHGRFRFLDLPIELRLMIYRICLLSDQEIGLPRFCSWYFKRDPAFPIQLLGLCPALLRVNRRITNEIDDLHWKGNHFVSHNVRLHSSGCLKDRSDWFKTAMNTTRKYQAKCTPPIRRFKFEFTVDSGDDIDYQWDEQHILALILLAQPHSLEYLTFIVRVVCGRRLEAQPTSGGKRRRRQDLEDRLSEFLKIACPRKTIIVNGPDANDSVFEIVLQCVRFSMQGPNTVSVTLQSPKEGCPEETTIIATVAE